MSDPRGSSLRANRVPHIVVGFELDALAALMVGTWRSENYRHVHEWGVGRRTIRSRSYVSRGGEWELVAEGLWHWDNEERVIRGTQACEDVTVGRFDYWTEVGGNQAIHDLRIHGSSVEQFVETWTFHSGEYRWRRERPTPGGLVVVAEGTAKRVRHRVGGERSVSPALHGFTALGSEGVLGSSAWGHRGR